MFIDAGLPGDTTNCGEVVTHRRQRVYLLTVVVVVCDTRAVNHVTTTAHLPKIPINPLGNAPELQLNFSAVECKFTDTGGGRVLVRKGDMRPASLQKSFNCKLVQQK